MKNKLKKILSLLTVTILSVGAITLVGCKDKSDEFSLNIDKQFGIVLTSSSPTTVSYNDGTYIEKTLTATVSTENENVDKYLIWSAKWENSSITEDLNEYLKIFVESDGSNVAKVRCYKNFESYGQIIITVSSKVKPNVYATCVATYKGKPTELHVKDYDGNRLDMFDGQGTGFVLNDKSLFKCSLDLQNLLGVGSDYNTFEISNAEVFSGTVTATCIKYNSGIVEDTQDITRNFIDDRTFSYNTSNNNGATVCFDEFFDFDNYISYTLDNNKLYFIGNLVIGKLFNTNNTPSNGVQAMLKSQNLIFYMKIKEVKSGVSADLYFTLNSDISALNVTSVSLNLDKIEF